MKFHNADQLCQSLSTELISVPFQNQKGYYYFFFLYDERYMEKEQFHFLNDESTG